MDSVDVDTRPHRQRLLDGLAGSIIETGFRDTTVAEIVRRARTSRRTFYEHFSSREECLLALLADANRVMIQRISEAVDPGAPWQVQVRQAIETWIACAEAEPAITLSWIRDAPALGAPARDLQRDAMEGFIAMTHRLTDTPALRAAGISPPSRQTAIILLGGLRELIATTVEDGGRAGDVTEVAVRASIALLGPA
ncbi:TetR/AcrR family transcriptional regulator [Amycolatopsis sp. NPDC005003]